MDILKILESGDVQRYHANPGISKQTNASHQWRVAMLMMWAFPDTKLSDLYNALVHDCAELITGDLPATLKWSNPEVKDLLDDIESDAEIDMFGCQLLVEPDIKAKIKICDMLEGMCYCIDRLQCGETKVWSPFTKWSKFVKSHKLYSNENIANLHRQLNIKFEKLGGNTHVSK